MSTGVWAVIDAQINHPQWFFFYLHSFRPANVVRNDFLLNQTDYASIRPPFLVLAESFNKLTSHKLPQ